MGFRNRGSIFKPWGEAMKLSHKRPRTRRRREPYKLPPRDLRPLPDPPDRDEGVLRIKTGGGYWILKK